MWGRECKTLYNQQRCFSLLCRATESCCPSRLSARLMGHGISPCPAVKVSDLRTRIMPPAVPLLPHPPKNMGSSASMTQFACGHRLIDMLVGRTCGGHLVDLHCIFHLQKLKCLSSLKKVCKISLKSWYDAVRSKSKRSQFGIHFGIPSLCLLY